jgi:fumarate hydratase class II
LELRHHPGAFNNVPYLKIAKKAHNEGTTLKQAALALGLVSEQQFDEWVKPEEMV